MTYSKLKGVCSCKIEFSEEREGEREREQDQRSCKNLISIMQTTDDPTLPIEKSYKQLDDLA